MALLVWFMTGIALWHFTVFLPDHFWQGIVGAFLGAVAGAMVSGAAAQIASGRTIGDTDLATVLYALPGIALGLAVVYVIGLRDERAA
jgi:glucose-6-phosphate-specific signal transduction histidine kinase